MSYAPEALNRDFFVIDAELDDRISFLRKTYTHLFAAVVAFVGLLVTFVNTPAIAQPMTQAMFGGQMLLIFGGFMLVSWIAHRLAVSGASSFYQYLGLCLYVVAEAIFFTPLVYYVVTMEANPNLILHAGAFTLLIFGGLTGIVLATRSDFSFLGKALQLGALIAFGLIILSFFTSLTLGIWFVVGVIVLMAGQILWETSQILHHMRTDQYVAASLALFASLATLFWYMIRLLMILNDD